MKRRGAVQIGLIVLTVLAIGGIIFGLYKYGVIEKDSPEKPPVLEDDSGYSEEEEELIEIEEGEIVEEDEDYDIAFGKEAPNFTLMNLEGKEVSLEDYRGKIVLINFWTTSCPFCIKEMPDIQKLSEENDDLVVLAVDVMEDKKRVKDYIEEEGYTFEVVLDEKGHVARTYLVGAFPTSYFVDKEGILLGGVPGMMTGPQMNEILENIRDNE